MVRIAVDAMGGDYAPEAIVRGTLQAAARHPDVSFVLVGPEETVTPLLTGAPANVSVHHASQWIRMDERPVQAVRQKPDASINVACHLAAQGAVDAVLTMGHTGAAFAAARFIFDLIPGVERPAVPVPYLAIHPRMVLIDVGANADVRPQHLLQFAIMGSVYAQRVFGIENPRVGLLTLGTEPRKGPLEVQDAYDLLERSGLNFVGCIEGLDVAYGRVDVVVHSGFVGNIVLKLTEGLIDVLLTQAAERAAAVAGEHAAAVREAIARLQAENAYSHIGAAPLLGVNGLIYIGHGRSREEAVVGAVNTVLQGVRSRLLDHLREAFKTLAVQHGSPRGGSTR